jgi:hypothetical protein
MLEIGKVAGAQEGTGGAGALVGTAVKVVGVPQSGVAQGHRGWEPVVVVWEGMALVHPRIVGVV